MRDSRGRRPLSFFLLAAVFGLFVVFLYGPLSAIFVLSFQGPLGRLTFPMQGFGTYWFGALLNQQRVGDFAGSFWRSFELGLVVTTLTMVIGTAAGLAYRRRFRGSTVIFYLTVASLIVPSILVSLGIGILFERLDVSTTWYSSGLGAQLTWTLPFALLITLAVFNRFNRAYEEAARDLGASDVGAFRHVVLPIILPSLIGVGLLGFTLSYDEFSRSLLVMGEKNTLPLEIYGMTTNVTSPALYALGTLTTGFSFVVIALALGLSLWIQRRRTRAKRAAIGSSDCHLKEAACR